MNASSNRSEVRDCTGFPLVAVFYKCGGSPLYSFSIVAMLLSMWVPHAAGVLQTRKNEGEVHLTFNILWTGSVIIQKVYVHVW